MTDPAPTVDSLTADLLADGPFVRLDAPYGLLEIEGPDAVDFLQRLCSQDVAALADGRLAPAAFLDAKGKVRATCLVGRLGATLWIETQAAQLDPLAQLLERYHFTEKLTIARREFGGCQERIVAHAQGQPAAELRRTDGGVVVAFARRGVSFVRAHGGAVADEGATALGAERAECLRMAAKLVAVGVETEPSTLALEADLDDHCSTDKGCYTGQEIVARIHTYGHVNRRLCLLRLAAGERITAPTPLAEPEDGIAVGRVMHAVPAPGNTFRVGLGYLPKDFQTPGTRLVLPDGGDAIVVA